MDAALVRLVWQRANARCEYCWFPADQAAQTFQIDHIIALQHFGLTIALNLALACFSCNNRKGPNLASVDPKTQKITRLFHPRRHAWRQHFEWRRAKLIGKTAVGRATIRLLEINHPLKVSIRKSMMKENRFPS